MRVFLIGYMASGKSKAGEQLAGMLGLKHVDTDTLVEEQTGQSIPSIFAREGEERFRMLEQEVLGALFRRRNIVVSTGGGLPCYGDTMSQLLENGIVVYLEANAGLLFHRLVRSRQGRPLLEGLNDIELMEKINAHLAERIPFYSRAHIVVPAASLDVKSLAARIRKQAGSA